MRRLKTIVALLMLAFWGLATAHCDLERLPGFEFLACSNYPSDRPHQDNDCKQDSCAVVEFGFYRSDSQPAALPLPVFVFDLLLALWETPAAADLAEALPPPSRTPELECVWQFSYRTALPPRAPSIDS